MRRALPLLLVLCAVLAAGHGAQADDGFDRLLRGEWNFSDLVGTAMRELGPILAGLGMIALVVAVAASGPVGYALVMGLGALGLGAMAWQGGRKVMEGYERGGAAGAWEGFKDFLVQDVFIGNELDVLTDPNATALDESLAWAGIFGKFLGFGYGGARGARALSRGGRVRNWLGSRLGRGEPPAPRGARPPRARSAPDEAAPGRRPPAEPEGRPPRPEEWSDGTPLPRTAPHEPVGAGKLTPREAAELQQVADRFDTTVYVSGSRARAGGRHVHDSRVPVGSGAAERSDIDLSWDTSRPELFEPLFGPKGQPRGAYRPHPDPNELMVSPTPPYIVFRPGQPPVRVPLPGEG